MSTTTKKKHINELTEEFRSYWEPLFSELGIETPLFFAKLCFFHSITPSKLLRQGLSFQQIFPLKETLNDF